MTSFLNFFQNRQSEILNLIQRLVDIESPSRDIVGSVTVADFLEREARTLRCVTTVERVKAENVGEHLIIRAFENENEKPILFLGHTDTVHPRGSFRENPTRIEGDVFYGCGIFDMKANCVLMLEILRAFDELGLKPVKPITILLSCDEEIGSHTGRPIVEREAGKSEFCLVCEPSANGKVKTGRKGTGNYILKARGIPAHAGLDPEKGASAILEISKQIPKLHALENPEMGTTVNICTISGGTTTNVIPEYAECTIDVRFTTMAEAARIEGEIKNLQNFDERVSLQIGGGINRPPLERNEKTIALYEKAKRIADEMNYEFGETQVGGASDGNFVAALGIPVLDGLGVTGNGAHTLHEHILVSDIPKRAALIASLLTAEFAPQRYRDTEF
jgi:glutamate carboxypeptidase